MINKTLYILECINDPGKYLSKFSVGVSDTGSVWKFYNYTEDLYEAIKFEDKQELINIRRASKLDLKIVEVKGIVYNEDWV